MTEDEMAGWHHQLNGHKFVQPLGSLACCSPRGLKGSDTTERHCLVAVRDFSCPFGNLTEDLFFLPHPPPPNGTSSSEMSWASWGKHTVDFFPSELYADVTAL